MEAISSLRRERTGFGRRMGTWRNKKPFSPLFHNISKKGRSKDGKMRKGLGKRL